MGLDMRFIKKQFADLVDNIQRIQPVAVSQFVIWLDEKVSEFKVNGQMRLDVEIDAPNWIKKYSMTMLNTDIPPSAENSPVTSITPTKQQTPTRTARKTAGGYTNSSNRRFNRPPKIIDIMSDAQQELDKFCEDYVVVTKRERTDETESNELEPVMSIAKRPTVSMLNRRLTPTKKRKSQPISLKSKLTHCDDSPSSITSNSSTVTSKFANNNNMQYTEVKTEPTDAVPYSETAQDLSVNNAVDMSLADGTTYVYPQDCDDTGTDYTNINNNPHYTVTTSNTKLSANLAENHEYSTMENSGGEHPPDETFPEVPGDRFYEGENLDMSYDDPAEYMEMMHHTEGTNGEPQPGTSESGAQYGTGATYTAPHHANPHGHSDTPVYDSTNLHGHSDSTDTPVYDATNPDGPSDGTDTTVYDARTLDKELFDELVAGALRESCINLTCLYCEFSSYNIKRYRHHLHFHLIGRKFPYSCVICGRKVQHLHHLVRHCFEHLGKIYKCPFCQYTCKRRDRFTSHITVDHSICIE